MDMLKSLGFSLMTSAGETLSLAIQGKQTTCSKAPINIKQAVARLRGANVNTDRSFPNKADTYQNGSTSTYSGGYAQWDAKSGSFNITMGTAGEGIKIDSDGTLVADHLKLNTSDVEKPHDLFGMPTNTNRVASSTPRMILTPMIDVIPDFSILNWTINLCNTVDKINEIYNNYAQLKADYKKRADAERAANNNRGSIL
jgi:hypothetical protein